MMTSRRARVLIPVALILIWLVGAGIGGPYFGRVGEVAQNDQSAFLPASAEATIVGQRYLDFVGDDEIPAIAIFAGKEALTDEQLSDLGATVKDVASTDGVVGASPLIPSEDGLAAQAFIGIDSEAELVDTVTAIRTDISDQLPDGIEFHITGRPASPATSSTRSAGSTVSSSSWPSPWCS
ncbi:MMPL family transporter [Tessaracoccus coleopterorum]|uniref:hypothetical protein n=1 Tax=Tessaracoccus coleopterorum TaxID=2714950 RepID=UPI002F90DC73